MKEYDECSKNPPTDTKIRLIDESDIFKWEIIMDGPKGSYYAVRSVFAHVVDLTNNFRVDTSSSYSFYHPTTLSNHPP